MTNFSMVSMRWSLVNIFLVVYQTSLPIEFLSPITMPEKYLDDFQVEEIDYSTLLI
jgi:hypothetical protein